MGTGKKESARRERQGTSSNDRTGNVRTKGENFYRSAKRVKTLNMFKSGEPTRNARGDITQTAVFQGREKPKALIEPHRKWFTNTRVISQDSLAAFRGAVEEQVKNPRTYLLKQNKLPMSLIRDNKDKERKDGLVQHQAKIRIESEKFGDTFGPKAQRKRPRLAVGSLEDMASASQHDFVSFQEKQDEARHLAGAAAGTAEDQNDTTTPENDKQQDDGSLSTAREPIFSKGQSKRIWNELYKVIDSSDVVIHVLDARDPLGTRCRSVEKYIREEAPHKHLLFLLNKCDLVPTSVAARWVKLLSQEYPTLAFHASLTNSFGKGTLISLLRQFSSLHSSRKQISVGFIGYPNTGKSSIINTLRKKKVCTTAPIPGETKVWQYITLMKRIYLIDCPGIVPPSQDDSPGVLLLRGSVRVENVENPAQYVGGVLGRCRRNHIERTYGIKGWGVEEEDISIFTDKQRMEEATRFLEALARKGGRLLKGGEADVDGVAKMVLNDFIRGKIPWFVPPPARVSECHEEGEDKVDVDVEGKEAGRDEKLGFTHKKRKREDEEADVAEEVEDSAALPQEVNVGAQEIEAGDVEPEDVDIASDEDEDEDEDEEENQIDFEGFDEEDDAESDASDDMDEHEIKDDLDDGGGVMLLDEDDESGLLG